MHERGTRAGEKVEQREIPHTARAVEDPEGLWKIAWQKLLELFWGYPPALCTWALETDVRVRQFPRARSPGLTQLILHLGSHKAAFSPGAWGSGPSSQVVGRMLTPEAVEGRPSAPKGHLLFLPRGP